MGKFIIIAVISSVLALGSTDFTCIPDSPNLVEFYGNNLTCPENLICNNKGKLINRETKPRACLAPKEICEYTCDAKNQSLVTVNLVPFVCDNDKQCNADKTSCDVCVHKPCDKSVYTCSKDNSIATFGKSFNITCPDNSCNSEYVYPCTPCLVSTTSALRRSVMGSIQNRSYFL